MLPPHLLHTYVLSPSQHATDMARRAIHALGAQRVLLFVRRTNQAMVTKYKLEARNMEVGVRVKRKNLQVSGCHFFGHLVLHYTILTGPDHTYQGGGGRLCEVQGQEILDRVPNGEVPFHLCQIHRA